ncbi:M15 family metallopeptidase [Ferruginibacter sp. HRS2-29]|uniref:M15 family metallopeptidase n=1 Tax=Ferruginibacter sp. HRS2-29 TaxID=2487334 RepID=UPI0020CE0BF9|nr:M15 family metallopeptidase [Ferruginibacter sp. HRS2-29]MCP9750734.1 peptidase M15 [Ferruginibacter sp. HRS2-29]
MVVFSTSIATAGAQDTTLNKYGLWVIGKPVVFQQTVVHSPYKKMVNIYQFVPGIRLDLRYAGKNNFMKQILYPPTATTYLRLPAATALAKVQNELKQKGLGLKIWDAYRPYSITEKMWEPVKDDRYAANPAFGSGHNRGVAVDLTITDLLTGKEIDMGTGFDDFSDSAHHDYKKLPGNVLANRLLLRTLMEKYGFKALESEWWHYALPEAKKYELLDLSFEDLKKLK